MKTEKTAYDLEIEKSFMANCTGFAIVVMSVLIISAFVFWNVQLEREHELKVLRYQSGDRVLSYDELKQTIDTIDNNCGSTFITKKYGETQYSVFVSAEKYIPLKECLE